MEICSAKFVTIQHKLATGVTLINGNWNACAVEWYLPVWLYSISALMECLLCFIESEAGVRMKTGYSGFFRCCSYKQISCCLCSLVLFCCFRKQFRNRPGKTESKVSGAYSDAILFMVFFSSQISSIHPQAVILHVVKQASWKDMQGSSGVNSKTTWFNLSPREKKSRTEASASR